MTKPLAVPPIILTLAKAIQKLEPTTQAKPTVLIVGGYVRDSIRHIPSVDIDLEVYGTTQKQLQASIQSIFGRTATQVGKSFGVYAIRSGKYSIDIALPRTEQKTGNTHTSFSISTNPNLTIAQALHRRDFTINAIAYNPITREYTDPYGGILDLRKGLLRVVAARSFTEDPLRIYRAVQFTARGKYTVEPNTKKLLRKMVASGMTQTLSKERITEEWKKLLLSKFPAYGLTLAFDIGLISRDYPELAVLQRTMQNPVWHPEGSVWNHTLLACTAAQTLALQHTLTSEEHIALVLAALLHDTGKAITTKKIKGILHSPGHEFHSVRIAQEFFNKTSFPKSVQTTVCTLILLHSQPRKIYQSLMNAHISTAEYMGKILRMLRDLAPVSWKLLSLLATADIQGRGKGLKLTPKWIAHISTTIAQNRQLQQPTKTIVSGVDILEITKKLHIPEPSGKKFGQIIAAVEDMRFCGQIQTKQQAKKYATSLLTGRST